MEPKKPLIDRKLIVDLLYGDENYVKEFADASVGSFSEFNEHFREALQTNDEVKLRNAGHKIKPVAQMMHLDYILELYEQSKECINDPDMQRKTKDLIQEMNKYCETLLEELKKLA